MRALKAFFQLIRPKQWTKNLVVFAGLMFSANLLDAARFFQVLQLFVVFCLAAGAVYIFNDWKDLSADRLHPQKKNRPLAAKAISPQLALTGALILLAASLAWSAALSPLMLGVVLLYLLLNAAYSLGLKNVVLLDVFTVTAGFVLRAAAGAWLIQVPISSWLLIVTTLLSLFLGFAKRRHELLVLGERAAQHRRSLGEYSAQLLDQVMGVVASATIISYCLYAATSPTAREYHDLMLTVPFVLYGVLRYLYLVYQKNQGGAPELILLRDRPMLVTILLWVLTAGLILYLK
jgi:4-hydroxybenzoate polyprenyltransferase